jgi:hypothetical protein
LLALAEQLDVDMLHVRSGVGSQVSIAHVVVNVQLESLEHVREPADPVLALVCTQALFSQRGANRTSLPRFSAMHVHDGC